MICLRNRKKELFDTLTLIESDDVPSKSWKEEKSQGQGQRATQ